MSNASQPNHTRPNILIGNLYSGKHRSLSSRRTTARPIPGQVDSNPFHQLAAKPIRITKIQRMKDGIAHKVGAGCRMGERTSQRCSSWHVPRSKNQLARRQSHTDKRYTQTHRQTHTAFRVSRKQIQSACSHRVISGMCLIGVVLGR
jgi:hypothetical protein